MTTANENSKQRRYLAVLSTLILDQDSNSPAFARALAYLSDFDDDQWREFFDFADAHHVTVRAFRALEQAATQRGHHELARRVEAPLTIEGKRIAHALRFLHLICGALEAAGCPVTVIKSLDHWPDLGGDLDLYTSADKSTVIEVLSQQLAAQLEPQSWGDRLANKWNFRIPHLPELVECHVKLLGQMGEQIRLARQVEQHRRKRRIADYEFPVPGPEERIVLATLQRMYRHFYIRLCDIRNVLELLAAQAVDFAELKKTSDQGAIWPGVATLLVIVAEYAKSYGAADVKLPDQVLAAAKFTHKSTSVGEKFLRIPILPQAAELYTQQMVGIGAEGDFRAMLRLSLLPALATAAFLEYKLTGSDKGIW